MRARHTRTRRPIVIVALVALVATAFGTMSASASAPAPPANDNYLTSLNFNEPHTPLNRVDTLRDMRNTTAATVQSDIFNPPLHGGPAELTGCNGVSEGKTIWYDF